MAIPTNGLDFYLPFDADMDEKIHSLTGTLSSSSAATYFMLSSDTAVGKFLRCIKTQGSSSYYLKYPGSESLMQYGTGDFSLSFWMRAPDWGNFTHVVFEKKYNDDYDGFVVFKVLAPLNLCCRLRKGSGEDSVDILTASAANSDKFIHWCFIRDAGGGRWYCNGLQEATSGELINECIEGGCNVDPGRAIGVNVSNSEIFKIGYSASWSSKQAVFDLKALRIYNRALSDSEITELSKEFADEGTSGGTGVVIDGLFLSTSKPTANQKGLLVNNKFFIPFAESSGSCDTSAFESEAMAIIGTPTGGGGEPGDEIITLVSESGSQGQSKVAINATGSVIVTNGATSQTYTEFPAEFTLSAGTTTIQGAVTALNCTTSTLTSIDISLCPTLTSLDCKGNALSALDISNNANLMTLACNNNGLTMLNIAQNTALKYLAAYSNKFTSDVVNNILASLVSNAKTNGTLDINYQEISAPPTGQGLVDKQTLIDRGWTVTTD